MTLAICSFVISVLLILLFKAHQRLSKFSVLISVDDQKTELEKEILNLKNKIQTETQELVLQKQLEIDKRSFELKDLINQIDTEEARSKNISDYIAKVELQKNEAEEVESLLDICFYNPKYNFSNSEQYMKRLEEIKSLQRKLIDSKSAIRCDASWSVSGSEKKGLEMTKQFIKLGLSSYNGQVDNVILTVSYKNIQKSKDRINKIKESINKMIDTYKCFVTNEYHELKIEELYLSYEYDKKVFEEKEEQKKIRLKMQEEAREIRAIEKVKEEAEREEKEYLKELSKAQKELSKAHDEEKETLAKRIEELETKLVEVGLQKERAISMAQQTRRGHVYIISNIGSFGEDIYKIGMTRRLDPMERIDELGDASVPFEFDVHGIIYSEDAPSLEKQLHTVFSDYVVNKTNYRKEFFNVSIHEIQKECNNHGLNIELTKIAEAREYRQSIEMKSNLNKKVA